MGNAFPTLVKPQANTAASITLSWQMMSMRIAWAPQRASGTKGNGGGGRFACPDPAHDGAVAFVGEKFVCADGHAYDKGEMLSAREVDGVAVLIDEDAKADAASGGTVKNEIDLIAVPRSQVEAFTRRDEGANRLRLVKDPSTTDRKLYRAYLGVAADPEFALVGVLNVRSRKLYVLDVWQGQLMLQPLIQTAELAPPDDLSGEIAEADEQLEALTAKLREKMVSSIVDFDAESFYYDKRKALDDLAAATARGEAPTPVASPAATSVDDLMAALDATIAAATPATPAKKAAAPKKKAASAA